MDGRMGSKWTLGRLVGGGVEWIYLAADRDRWWAVVNVVMNLRVLAPQSYVDDGHIYKVQNVKNLSSSNDVCAV
jgi:hypothetical protein